MEQLFTLRDGRKTACNTFDFFEWLITDFQFFEKETLQRLRDVRLSLRELRKMKASAKMVSSGRELLVARKSGNDLADEGLRDGDLLGLMVLSPDGLERVEV